MPNYDESRMGDPDYAPGISWSGRYAYWKCPKAFLNAGYEPSRVKLTPGHRDDEHQIERARLCREMSRSAEAWWQSRSESTTGNGTWGYVIQRYRTDEFSPYQEVKENTRENYDYLCDRWNGAIGQSDIGAMDFVTIKQIERAMKDNGRTVSNIKRMFTMLRTLASYATALKIEGARDVKDVLGEVRFKTPPARNVAATRDQIYDVVAEADAKGAHAFAVGIIMQFEFALRAVDVRGQWFKISEDEWSNGGVVRRTFKKDSAGKPQVTFSRWQDGLTWDMFSPDLSSFTKVISKTQKSLPEPYQFDLTPLPDLQRRLLALRGDQQTGPVIITERHQLPYERNAWSKEWRRLADRAGVPKEVCVMDARSGALTEAAQMGATPLQLRNAGQHSNVSTTDKYLRARSDDASKVVQLRQGSKS